MFSTALEERGKREPIGRYCSYSTSTTCSSKREILSSNELRKVCSFVVGASLTVQVRKGVAIIDATDKIICSFAAIPVLA